MERKIVYRLSGCPMIFLLLILAAGCHDRPATQSPTDSDHQQQYAELAGLRRSTYHWLQEEYARLHLEEALPLQLDAKLSTKPLTAGVSQVAQSTSEARTEATDLKHLAAVYPAFSRGLLDQQIKDVFPTREMQFGPAELTKARDILHRLKKERQEFAAAWKQVDRLAVPFRDGLLADLDIVESARVGCRLEMLHAATLLADGTPEIALEAVLLVQHVAQVCGQDGHFPLRVLAADLRSDLVDLIAALHNHSRFSLSGRERLLEPVAAQAVAWPDDATLWIVERAIGLHTFELVRDGHFLSLLSEAEATPLREKNILNVTARTALRNVDADEKIYLEALRRMLTGCDLPQPQRMKIVAEIREDIQAKFNTPDYPLVSATILLNDLETGVRRQGEDRALWQALLLGLQLAADNSAAALPTNPFTGEPFEVSGDAQCIHIDNILGPTSRSLHLCRSSATTQARTTHRNMPAR